MFRFLKSYSTYYILMFCIGLLFLGIFYQMTGVWIFLWVVPGIPFVFLGCQAIIYKSDFSPGPYYGSAISAILSIALPFGAFWDWTDAGGSLPLLGWVVLWVALLFYLPLAMMLGWSIGKSLT